MSGAQYDVCNRAFLLHTNVYAAVAADWKAAFVSTKKKTVK